MLDIFRETPRERASTNAVVEDLQAELPRRLLWWKLAEYGDGAWIENQFIPIDRVGLWVVSDDRDWVAVLPAIARFLEGEAIGEEAYALALPRLKETLS